MYTKNKIAYITESWEEEISAQSLLNEDFRVNLKGGKRGFWDGAIDWALLYLGLLGFELELLEELGRLTKKLIKIWTETF